MKAINPPDGISDKDEVVSSAVVVVVATSDKRNPLPLLPSYTGADAIPENTSKNTHKVVAEMLAEEENCQRILDLPCGAGAFTRRMLMQGAEDVIAADCQNILQFSYDKFALADMNRRLDFPDNTFDAVVCIDGIEHVERPFDFIEEARRVLRRGGVLVISTPNLMALRSRWRWLLTGFHQGEKIPLDESNRTPLHHISLVSFTDLRYRLHTRRLRVTSVRTNRYRWIGLVYGVFAPVSYLMTRWVFYKEGRRAKADAAQLQHRQAQDKEILRQIFSAPVLFGETLIVKAVCEK